MIIGIVGPIASGKNLATDILVEKEFIVKNFSDAVREEAKKRGLPIERKVLQDIGNVMREKYGNGYWATKILEGVDLKKNYVFTGIRNPGEIEELKKITGFVLIGIDAPIERRLKWIIARNKDSDPKTEEGVRLIDARDRGIGEKSSGQQSQACFEVADHYIYNNGSLEELRDKVERLLVKLGIFD